MAQRGETIRFNEAELDMLVYIFKTYVGNHDICVKLEEKFKRSLERIRVKQNG